MAVRGQCHTSAVGRVWGAAAEPPGPKAELCEEQGPAAQPLAGCPCAAITHKEPQSSVSAVINFSSPSSVIEN